MKDEFTFRPQRKTLSPLPGRHHPLFTNTELLNHAAVLSDIFFLQILEKTATLADQLQQSTPGMMILGVLFKMLGQIRDPFRQQGYLHLAGAGIRVMGFKLLNNLFFLFCCLCHNGPPLVVLLLPGKPIPKQSVSHFQSNRSTRGIKKTLSLHRSLD